MAGCSNTIAAGTATPSPYTLKHQPAPYIRETPLEYHLYLPKTYTPEREWPLFVGLHGAGGSAYECLAQWLSYADREGFVLLCPSLQDPNGNGWEHDEKKVTLNEIIASIKEECRLKPQVFLAGFSRGGHLVQRFAWAYPEITGGAAVLSAVMYDPPAPLSKTVPFLVVLGDYDHRGGVEKVQAFAAELKDAGFSVDLQILPKVGHLMTEEARELTMAFFRQTVGKQTQP